MHSNGSLANKEVAMGGHGPLANKEVAMHHRELDCGADSNRRNIKTEAAHRPDRTIKESHE
jgi:hypothetical protein